MRRKNLASGCSTGFIIIFLIFLIPIRPLAALDYSDSYGALADFFALFLSDNEGVTGFRSLNIPSGGRSEAMGTAYSALANDVSFIEYNPAASAILARTELALFHNAWVADSAMETIAWTMRNANKGTGAALRCFYVPFTEYNMLAERVAGGYYSETVATYNLSYNFFPGYTFKGLAVGMNAKLGYRSVPDYSDGILDHAVKGSGASQSGLALMGDFGILLQFDALKRFASRDANLRIGISLNNLGVSLTGFGKTLMLDDPLPTRVAAGVSYRIISPLTITAEVRAPMVLTERPVISSLAFASGIEVVVTKFLAVQGGFLIQSGNPRISLGGEVQIQKIQLNAAYTFDLTSSVTPINRISVSAKVDLGDRGRAALRAHADALYARGLKEYSVGNFESAIAAWKECLTIDAFFDPAKVAIKTAEEMLFLHRRIITVQSLD